ncbi:CRISPR-associated protein Cas4 [Dictyobacter arantiisoli]|uniref:DUF83 domain-containing protein n=1 Tax=Dictyobacter arantiisoli TaxID=2014874 RepID=A0A5A5TKC0_9CHLR|nr:Dna2/Cas4 domain-containing protein [Dictyobacter arantiisoli]GCF11705.1 hypothetical protein KDI_52690 [Dictyobacter arantiisoli]
MPQRKQSIPGTFQRNYTAKEVAQYDYCPLVWWHEQYDVAVNASTDTLFAQLVALEHEYGTQAPNVPDYQVIEQLLVRRGAFSEEYQASHQQHDAEDYNEYRADSDEDYAESVEKQPRVRLLLRLAFITLALGILLVLLSGILLSVLTLSAKWTPITLLFASGVGLLLFSLACFLLLFNERRVQRERLIEAHHQALGLPPGELVYENTDSLGEALTSDIYPLLARPAYVVKLQNNLLFPVDIKPIAQNTMTPEPHHVLQVATYCLILEEYAEEPPTHGLLRYTDRDFTIEYTPALRRKIIRLLKEMDLCSAEMPPALQKQKASKCRACIYQPICPVGYGK